MNYDEIIQFIKDHTYGGYEVANTFNKAIAVDKSQQSFYLSLTIGIFRSDSVGYEHDIDFMRAAIDYIDGLNANQDNGEQP